MADVEVRRVVIEYEIRIPSGPPPREIPTSNVTPEMVEAIRRELIRMGSRNPDIFGGRA
jgi:hypothetical protein